MAETTLDREIAKSTPWDVFIHLLAVIAIYSCVYATITLAVQYVNLAFPDPLDRTNDGLDRVRYAVAILIVFFPTYWWAWRAIGADLAANPAKQRMWIRTCPIYLTLFLAGLLALGDLVCFIYYFLGGDLTTRFVLKVSSVLLVSVVVLYFYRDALRRQPGSPSTAARNVALGAIAAVASLVIAGFVAAGSPDRARMRRFDETRIENLAVIQRQLVEQWQNHGALPASLAGLSDPITGFRAPTDPETTSQYGYHLKGPTSFELCADFRLESVPEGDREAPAWVPGVGQLQRADWQHPRGHVCFSRTIDPAKYPPKNKAAH